MRGEMRFAVTFTEAEDGWIVAECPELPGCVSQGRDQAQARVNIEEAIVAWLWAEKSRPDAPGSRAKL